MRLHRHAATLAAGLMVSAFAPTLYAQASRIAVVDLQRAISETEDGRREINRLKRMSKRRQAQLDQETEALKQAKAEFDRQLESGVITDEAAQERAGELQKQYVELQQKFQAYQREIAERQQKATAPIVDRLQRILRRIGQSEGYTLIVDRGQAGVVWSPSNLDLTDQVIQRYNAGEGRSGGSGRGRSKRRSSD